MIRSIPYQAPVQIKANGIETVYDVFGRPGDPPLVLVAGLGAQMIAWDEQFCAQLAGCGFQVIRFDNRDVGQATIFREAGVPDIGRILQARLEGKMPNMLLPYTIDDMVNDTISVLDKLEHEQVHLVGASMGGAIAQLLAIKHPDRVKSLTTIMTSSGDPNLPRPLPQAIALITQPAPKNRAEYIEKTVAGWRAFQGSAYPLDEEVAGARAGHFYDRSYTPDGVTRQLAAVASLESLKPGLRNLTVPTLVIHGDEDPLFPIECGRDIATSVPGAKMLVLTGVGHALPPAVWPHVIDAIANHAT